MSSSAGKPPRPAPTEAPAALVGRTGHWACDTLQVQVRILEAKQAYGRWLVRIAPVAGTGAAWVYLTRVQLDAPA